MSHFQKNVPLKLIVQNDHIGNSGECGAQAQIRHPISRKKIYRCYPNGYICPYFSILSKQTLCTQAPKQSRLGADLVLACNINSLFLGKKVLWTLNFIIMITIKVLFGRTSLDLYNETN